MLYLMVFQMLFSGETFTTIHAFMQRLAYKKEENVVRKLFFQFNFFATTDPCVGCGDC